VTGRERKETDPMSSESRTEMQRVEGAMSAGPEQTRSGAVYMPAVDIFETDGAITVLADMPGVKADQLEIDLRENVLTLTGRVATAPTGETDVLREYDAGTFFRQFTLAETIDQTRIDAKLADGVLRLELPKVERAKPRQITVRSG
jgi:HSP20 family molecular chaperone IbpA